MGGGEEGRSKNSQDFARWRVAYHTTVSAAPLGVQQISG